MYLVGYKKAWIKIVLQETEPYYPDLLALLKGQGECIKGLHLLMDYINGKRDIDYKTAYWYYCRTNPYQDYEGLELTEIQKLAGYVIFQLFSSLTVTKAIDIDLIDEAIGRALQHKKWIIEDIRNGKL